METNRVYQLLYQNNLYGYAASKFFPTDEFEWLDPTKFSSNEYVDNCLRCSVSVELENLQELHNMHNDYYSDSDISKIKRAMLSNNQLKITDGYNISINNVKKLASNFSNKETYKFHYKNLQIYLRLGLKMKNYIIY